MKRSLSIRIYALGLLQTVAVMVGLVVFLDVARPEPPQVQRGQEYGLLASVEGDFGDSDAVGRHLERAREHGLEAQVFDASGTVVASSIQSTEGPCRALEQHRPPPPPGTAPPHGPPPGPPPHGGGPYDPRPDGPETVCYALPIHARGQMGKIEFRRRMPAAVTPFAPPVVLMTLLVVAICSWLLLRSIVRPLRALGNSAAAFGRGDLSVRTGVERDDELGDVANAFDTMAERIEKLVRGERELIANISHEFRTPLARIRVAVDLATESQSAEDVRVIVGDIGEELDELDQLVQDVLDDARAHHAGTGEPGTPRLHVQELGVVHCLEASMERFARLYPQRPLDVDIDAAGSLRGDPVLLRRMLDNILDNAVRYSEAPVSLLARANGDVLRIVVSDQGIGIASEELEDVFRPFYRTDRSRARRTGGVGLGLGLARKIAIAHDGVLSLESQPGAGTRVAIELPLHRTEA